MALKKNSFLLCFLMLAPVLISQSSCGNFSTYFGGSQFDEVKSICVDLNKNTYVIGNTYSNNLPATPGLINDTASGNYDVFIAKFDSCGMLLWLTYFGGTGQESAEKMELAYDGNIVFCGYTNSTTTPTTPGCFQTVNNGGYDCFLTKVTPGGFVIWSTFFGKDGGDFAFDIKTDELNNIIIGGTTTSTNLYTTNASFQQTLKGNTDAFIARFSKDGLLKWCTYYGGNGSEDIHALATDNNCNIIGIGESFSQNLNTSTSAFQQFNDGGSDAYILKLDSNCTRIFSSYFGGSGYDDAWGLACDVQNTIYMAGHTNSADFDVTVSAHQPSLQGGLDCFVSKWSPSGTLLYSSYFGGPQNDYTTRLILKNSQEFMLLCETENTNMPVYPSSQQTTFMGVYDFYLSSFNLTNMVPNWGTYYGGSGFEDAMDLKRVNDSTVILCGSSNSADYPTSASAYQPALNIMTDGVITIINTPMPLTTELNYLSVNKTGLVYPNPFKDVVHLKLSEDSDVELKTIFGDIVYASKNSTTINTKDLPSGVYILSVNGNAFYKLLKQ